MFIEPQAFNRRAGVAASLRHLPLSRSFVASSLRRFVALAACVLPLSITVAASGQVAVHGDIVHTMAGPSIEDGVVIIRDGKIAAVGPAASMPIPEGFRVLRGSVVTPGLIDAHSTVGLSGIYNHPHDQDQIERSSPMQPELRAIDAYNTQEPLVAWVRNFGVTTMHTGHAPGELISGQTCVVKTAGNTVNDALLVDVASVSVTLGPSAQKSEKGQSPGTRGKMMAMLRQELIKTQEYLKKKETAEEEKKPARELNREILARVLNKEVPLMITANRSQDIVSALRLQEEFGFRMILDSASEAYLHVDAIKASGVPVIIHPTMKRAVSETENLSFETAAKLQQAGILVAMQSGYESYVPKTRVILFEAGLAAANGLGFNGALRTITIDAAKLLGVDKRVGSLEVGKDGDVAVYDGDPFEYTTHCVGVVINGQVVSDTPH